MVAVNLVVRASKWKELLVGGVNKRDDAVKMAFHQRILSNSLLLHERVVDEEESVHP
ncbi:unnamed protein product [Camellia sinensis]